MSDPNAQITDVVIRITLDTGGPLELRPASITPSQASALRVQSHGTLTVPVLMRLCDDGIGPEELTGLVFLARRQAGDEATFDAVAAGINGATQAEVVFDVDGAVTLDEADSPEG